MLTFPRSLGSLSLFALSAVGAVNSLQASEMPATSGYFCQLHYTKNAYGKPVASVLAHTGVEKKCAGTGNTVTWDDIKDRQLAASTDGEQFQGKILMLGKTSSNNAEACTLSPVVQFWVKFEDGSEKIEEVAPMQVKRQFLVNSNRIEDNQDLVTWMNYLGSLEDRAIEKVSCFSARSVGETIVELTNQVQPSLLQKAER